MDGPHPELVWLGGYGMGEPFYEQVLLRLREEHGLSSTFVPPPWAAPRTPGGCPWREAARQLAGTLEGPSILIGHSMGAMVATLTALGRPTGLEGLILIEPLLPTGPRMARAIARRYIRSTVAARSGRFENHSGLARRIASPASYPPWAISHHLEGCAQISPEVARNWFESLPGLFPLQLPSPPPRSMIVRGVRSGPGPRWMLARLARKLRTAKIEVVPGAGHWIFNEADDAIVGLVGRFAAAGQKSRPPRT